MHRPWITRGAEDVANAEFVNAGHYLDGRTLAKCFAWLLQSDLIRPAVPDKREERRWPPATARRPTDTRI